MPPTSAGRDSGFTLLEVLIAFAIVSALLAGLLTLARDTGRTADHAYRVAATVEAARSTLTRIGPEYDIQPGTLEIADGPILTTVTIEASDLPRLWSVSARASWGTATTQLDTLRAVP